MITFKATVSSVSEEPGTVVDITLIPHGHVYEFGKLKQLVGATVDVTLDVTLDITEVPLQVAGLKAPPLTKKGK